jgi:hypothetical protein
MNANIPYILIGYIPYILIIILIGTQYVALESSLLRYKQVYIVY